MSILLTHTTALEAMRSRRLRWRLEKGERCDGDVPERVPDNVEIERLIGTVPELARASKPLHLLVSREAPRTRRSLAHTHASPDLPPGSAFELARGCGASRPSTSP